jgi:hypothetical protein
LTAKSSALSLFDLASACLGVVRRRAGGSQAEGSRLPGARHRRRLGVNRQQSGGCRIKALNSVDVHGDVAPAHVQDPMTMLLRENAIQAHLMRWDDGRGRYVLTGTGRRRIGASSRAPGTVVSFRERGVVGAVHRKSANTNLKE